MMSQTQDEEGMMVTPNTSRQRILHRRVLCVLRYGWPVLGVLLILWFPFDWLSVVWLPFGVPFRMVFHTAHDHFIGHTVFFLIVGVLILAYLPTLRRQPLWYFLGLVLAALIQEAIQALFRGQVPTFTDTNAFAGDALGGISAFVFWGVLPRLPGAWKRRLAAKPPTTSVSAPGQEQK